MKEQKNKMMILIGGGQTIRIAQDNIPVGHPAADIDGCFLAEHRAEVVPQTEAAYADYIARHGGAALHPTLAAYPNTRR